MKRFLRRAALLAGLVTLGVTPIAAVPGQIASAQRIPADFAGVLGDNRYIGEIVALVGPTNNPTGVMLQFGTDTTDITLGPKYTAQPQSAEAEVEGLAVDDYAVITVHPNYRGDLIAQRVQFDVEPFGRLRLMTGLVTWVSPNDKRMRLRLPDTGAIRTITLIRSTKYEVDGKQVAPLILGRDQTVQVLVLHLNFSLLAVDVNLKTSTTLPPR
jgi:hypothetical protein